MPPHTKEPTTPWHYIAKLVCIGDSSTGKSSLTTRLCEGRFSTNHDVTIGVEFGSRVVPVGPPANAELGINAGNAEVQAASKNTKPEDQKKMKLSLWDTAGQETYKSVTRSYFRGASGALLIFDITRRSTFEAVTGWLNDLRQLAEEGIVIVLVGNKLDLADHTTNIDGGKKRAVTRQEAEDWCKREGIVKYIETSAKSGENVERAFLEVAERIYQNIEAGRYDLNDRRSGVKGYGSGTGRDVIKQSPSVNLSLNHAAKGKSGAGCC
ncbi:hypothetical protein LTR70_006203 [Exophiala xenobiotica]|uniref:Uncharacterized protein n=1 Tax=Lithohypha guttulata TaxID=1690604 RepID=A0ABR0K7R8_9EURO|nr:hypothetical protein LTR24_005880 [Lithohypha guttulata]KAK5316654.1 hypothetical protein LTR70_006203 [Exophiala xenobiotica]